MSKKYTSGNIIAWSSVAAAVVALGAAAIWPDSDERLVAQLDDVSTQFDKAKGDLQKVRDALTIANAKVQHLQNSVEDLVYEADEDLAATYYAIGYDDGKKQNNNAAYSSAACETYAVLQNDELYRIFDNKVLANEDVRVEVSVSKQGVELGVCNIVPEIKWLEEDLSKLTHGP
ncbi:MAG: hypothetical protein AB8B83_04385 [Bdellovibrionales bacterium]